MSGYYSFQWINDCKEHQQLVSQTIISYFNDLGEKLADSKESGTKLKLDDAIPTRAYNMRQMGCASTLLDADFTVGTEHRICEKLFGVNKGDRCNYHWYFNSIYKLVCEELNWKYVSYENTLIKQAIKAHARQKAINASMTFKDLYDFIQTAKRNDLGYHIVSEKAALHIYDDRLQVNICMKDSLSGVFVPIANILFCPGESVVNICAVNDGMINYDMNWKVLMNVSISQLRKTPDMQYGSKIRKIIFAALE